MAHCILILPLILALGGFIFSTRVWIMFLNKLSPFKGLVVYYIIILVLFLILKKIGINIGGIEFNNTRHVIGSLLIFFSFFVLFDFTSCYQNMLLYGTCDNVPKPFLQSEDGAVYTFWNYFTSNLAQLRILTYVITPFILTLVGVALITHKVTLSA
jgi:hypothetical protein